VERVALGAVMTMVAFVVERRLMKVIRKRGDDGAKAPEAGRHPPGRNDVTLTATPQQVEQEPRGDRAAQAPQDHRDPSRDV
jgi:hypothetical protein